MRKLISVLIFTLVASFSHAEEEDADFSFFHDPNEAMPAKSSTQAEPPCISCNGNAVKPKNVQDHEQVIKKVQKQEPECITCGRVSLEKVGKATVAGASVWNQFPGIGKYSSSKAVQKMIDFALRRSRSVSQHMCLRAVKEAMCGAPSPACSNQGLTKGYLPGSRVFPEDVGINNQNNFIENLTNKKNGFVNLLSIPKYSALIKNPASAPKGAILVYSGGKRGGHVEIKTGHGTSGLYVSDFRAQNSVMKNELAGRASANYKLVGVLIKPQEEI